MHRKDLDFIASIFTVEELERERLVASKRPTLVSTLSNNRRSDMPERHDSISATPIDASTLEAEIVTFAISLDNLGP
jgi:hypothetical protein